MRDQVDGRHDVGSQDKMKCKPQLQNCPLRSLAGIVPRERESSWRSDGLKTKVSSHAFYFPSLDFNLGSVIVFLQFFV